MLVPLIGEFWTGVAVVAFVAVALVATAALCRWLDAPRRELIQEIKRRPTVTIRLRWRDA